jgi:hypothetical protein
VGLPASLSAEVWTMRNAPSFPPITGQAIGVFGQGVRDLGQHLLKQGTASAPRSLAQIVRDPSIVPYCHDVFQFHIFHARLRVVKEELREALWTAAAKLPLYIARLLALGNPASEFAVEKRHLRGRSPKASPAEARVGIQSGRRRERVGEIPQLLREIPQSIARRHGHAYCNAARKLL